MEKEVDIITLCKRLIDLTKQEKCVWKETSENNRFKLGLKNGTVELYHYSPGPLNIMESEFYEVSLFDRGQFRYATYKGMPGQDDGFKTFSALYREVRNLLEKQRRRKIALLFEELEEPEDKK